MIELLQGDCLDLLPTLKDESVQCVVTSPPYYGLRDYGTGEFEGGDPHCNHVFGGQVADGKNRNAISGGVRPGCDASVCKVCGAKRIDSQIGLEKTPDEYVAKLVAVFRDVRRVLRNDGVVFLNLGDSYAGGKTGRSDADRGKRHTDGRDPQNQNAWKSPGAIDREVPEGLKPKDLIGTPWRCAFALQADGWFLRQEIIWHKPNPMPESVRDRCTKSHEHVFLLTKNSRYFWNYEANMEEAAYDGRKDCQMKGSDKYKDVDIPGAKANSFHVGGHPRWTFKDGKAWRNRRSVWSIPTKPSREAHFAMMPPRLAELCILAGSRPGDVILDPFAGAGTTGMVARQLQRRFIGIELSKESCQIAHRRIYEEPKPAKSKPIRGKYKDALTPSDLPAQQKLW